MNHFNLRCLWKLTVLALASTICASPAAAKQPLNVLLIMADDLNCDLGCYGNKLVQSPEIDRLAARGVRFDRAYCQYPVCNPSRVSFLSGRRPDSTRVIDLVTPSRAYMPDVVFLPQHFRQQGYRTIKVGKIFHTGEGFEDPASWDLDIREDTTSKKPPDDQIAGTRGMDGVMLRCDDAATWDGFVARRGVELLAEAAAGKQPFFLAIGFRRPHRPYIAPQKYFDMYPPSIIPPLVEPASHLAKIPKLALPYLFHEKPLLAADRPNEASSYYASISFLDAQLGLVLDAIDQSNLWDSTVVVFVSDHGYHLGEHGGLCHKMTLFEASARVPLIIAAPGKQSAASRQLVELTDVYPTLCTLCELSQPEGLEGKNMDPLLNGTEQPIRPATSTVLARGPTGAGTKLEFSQLGRSIRTDRWRYTEWFDGSRELYDYDNDPNEYRNLAQSPEGATVVEQHRKLLAELQKNR